MRSSAPSRGLRDWPVPSLGACRVVVSQVIAASKRIAAEDARVRLYPRMPQVVTFQMVRPRELLLANGTRDAPGC